MNTKYTVRIGYERQRTSTATRSPVIPLLSCFRIFYISSQGCSCNSVYSHKPLYLSGNCAGSSSSADDDDLPTLPFTVHQFSNFQFSNFPILQFSILQFSIFPFFNFSIFANLQFFNFAILQFAICNFAILQFLFEFSSFQLYDGLLVTVQLRHF